MDNSLYREFTPQPSRSRWRLPLGVLLTVLTILPIVFLTSLLMSGVTISYRIHAGVLEIHGGEGLLSNHRTIPLADIRETGEVSLRGGRRVFGTGLPGFCAGRFSYPDLGSVWQVTDCRSRVVLLRAEGEPLPILVTPPDAAAFLTALREGHDSDHSPTPAPARGWWHLAMGLLLVLMTPVAIFVPLAVFRASSRLRYLVGNGELVVQLLILRKRFPLAGRTARRYTPSRAWKRAGSSIPGYHAGSFSVDGETARVYASVVKAEGVMIEGAPRVFVAPDDPEGFLAALRRQGVRIVETPEKQADRSARS